MVRKPINTSPCTYSDCKANHKHAYICSLLPEAHTRGLGAYCLHFLWVSIQETSCPLALHPVHSSAGK
jgi:hypothetical protein